MNLLTLLGIAVGLAMDALAVSVAAGLSLPRVTSRHAFRVAFHFGLFQFLMPVIGWASGRRFAAALAGCDHWIAFALLAAIGLKMLHEGLGKAKSSEKNNPDGTPDKDPTRGWTLVMLSIATSIDALAVGVSLALVQETSIWLPSIVIGLVAATFSALGITFGARLGARFEHWAESAGGVILIAIGLHVLFSHLCA